MSGVNELERLQREHGPYAIASMYGSCSCSSWHVCSTQRRIDALMKRALADPTPLNTSKGTDHGPTAD